MVQLRAEPKTWMQQQRVFFHYMLITTARILPLDECNNNIHSSITYIQWLSGLDKTPRERQDATWETNSSITYIQWLSGLDKTPREKQDVTWKARSHVLVYEHMQQAYATSTSNEYIQQVHATNACNEHNESTAKWPLRGDDSSSSFPKWLLFKNTLKWSLRGNALLFLRNGFNVCAMWCFLSLTWRLV